MIVLDVGIIPKVLSEVRTLVEIRKEKNPRKLVGLGSVSVMPAGVRFIPPERDSSR